MPHNDDERDYAEEQANAALLRPENEEPFYEWRCFGTVVCEPMLDQHGRECDRLNDEAREEFYADLVADDIAHAVRWHARQALLSATRGAL